MENKDEPRGMPIYADRYDRQLPDPTSADETDWYPATPPTRKLWRCYECLQKIHFALDRLDANSSEKTRRRFLVNFAVPLDDFFICILELSRSIEGDKQTRGRLNSEELVFLREQRKRFNEAVIDQSQSVKEVRNKLGAHTDKKLEPVKASKLVDDLDVNLVGSLLHGSLLVLRDTARLDCYAWSSKGYRDDETRLMNCEPFVVNFKSGSMGDLVGIEQTESPKRHIFERIADIVEASTWMFAENQSRLVVNIRSDGSGH